MVQFRTVAIDWTKYDFGKAKELAAKYGQQIVSQMLANIHQLDLIDRGNLLKSVKYSIRTRDGEVERIQFVYEWYGRFHETGVIDGFGKGINIPGTQWRSSAMDASKPELDADFAEFYAALILKEISIDSVKMRM